MPVITPTITAPSNSLVIKPTTDATDAIIQDEIGGKDAEIALINNELASPGTAEYAAYQALRQHAKDIANEVLPWPPFKSSSVRLEFITPSLFGLSSGTLSSG